MTDKELDNAIFRAIAEGLTGRGKITDLQGLLDAWKRHRCKTPPNPEFVAKCKQMVKSFLDGPKGKTGTPDL